MVGAAGRRARAATTTAANARSGSQPKTTSQIIASAKTCIIAPSAASARPTVLAGSQTLVDVSPGRAESVEMDIEIVEKSVRCLMLLICAVSCSTCVRTFPSDASTLRISSMVFARFRIAIYRCSSACFAVSRAWRSMNWSVTS